MIQIKCSRWKSFISNFHSLLWSIIIQFSCWKLFEYKWRYFPIKRNGCFLLLRRKRQNLQPISKSNGPICAGRKFESAPEFSFVCFKCSKKEKKTLFLFKRSLVDWSGRSLYHPSWRSWIYGRTDSCRQLTALSCVPWPYPRPLIPSQ